MIGALNSNSIQAFNKKQPGGVAPKAPKRCDVSARSMLKGCRLVGVGSAAPATILSNQDLAGLVDTNDEWIASRTGIKRRHVLGQGESLSQLAKTAGERALDMAGVAAEEIDLILYATSSPDDVFGGACQLQALIGARNAVCFDITAACSGFVLALVTASQFIRTGAKKKVLVVGADALSRFVDWRDRSTCILFGDGCGAVVVTSTDEPCSLLGMDMHSDGNGQKSLNCLFNGEGPKATLEQGASNPGSYKNVMMNGQEVYK
jgi:3-oxoacyl-[acyl-carrier-protein] synthase-3